jgi:hypothetical protein
VKTEGKRVCEVCGTALSENSDFCPVCALQGALAPEKTESLPDISSELHFEHYQVLKNEDGTPLELGRGGMGVTYKAIDTHLRCPVALKIIGSQFIGNESARSRFVREARAAAGDRTEALALGCPFDQLPGSGRENDHSTSSSGPLVGGNSLVFST